MQHFSVIASPHTQTSVEPARRVITALHSLKYGNLIGSLDRFIWLGDLGSGKNITEVC